MKKEIRRTICLILVFCGLLAIGSPASAAATLQYSELSYIPSNYRSFNCYGYAIGTNRNIDPGYYSGRTFACNATTIKNNVIADLKALGYTNVRSVSASYTLRENEHLIAFTCGWWEQISNVRSLEEDGSIVFPLAEGNNYHFWRKDANGGYWYHKFGITSAIMRLKSGYTPENIVVTDESYNGAGYVSPAGHYLPGASIYYIVYENTTSRSS